MAQMIFGRLYSFGGLDWHSSSSPIYPVKTGWPKEFQSEFEQGLLQVGHEFLYDSFGLEQAPLRNATLTYEVALLLLLSDKGTRQCPWRARHDKGQGSCYTDGSTVKRRPHTALQIEPEALWMR